MASMLSHLSCSSSVIHELAIRRRQALYPVLHSKADNSMIFKGCLGKLPASHIKTTLRCSAQPSIPYTEDLAKPQPTTEENGSVYPTTNQTESHAPIELKKSAKIHDFCFGIPFGSFIVAGGVVGFIVTRNVAILFNGILSGGALLVLSVTSLKVWRQGKSCFPFILGQAVIAAALMWTNYHGYQLTRSIFPTAVFFTISAAMLCFYSYVVISGGNPPPKKSKPSASVAVS